MSLPTKVVKNSTFFLTHLVYSQPLLFQLPTTSCLIYNVSLVNSMNLLLVLFKLNSYGESASYDKDSMVPNKSVQLFFSVKV